MFANDWRRLTPDQRFEARMRVWLEPRGVEFADRDARRLPCAGDDAPGRDRGAQAGRVPVAPSLGLFAAF